MDDYDPVETDTCFSYQDTYPGLSSISLRFSVHSLGQSLDVSAAPHSMYIDSRAYYVSRITSNSLKSPSRSFVVRSSMRRLISANFFFSLLAR